MISIVNKLTKYGVKIPNMDILLSCIRSTSTSTRIDTVGVIGLGLMGHGICQVAAVSGNHSSVIAFDSRKESLDRGRKNIESSILKMVSKGKISEEDANRNLKSIVYTTEISDVANVDLVVEAVIENMDLKRKWFQKLNDICKPETIFASNTSSLSITELAEASNRPELFLGLHFFNPVQMMRLVEVVYTKHTNTDTFDKAFNWVKSIDKEAVKCGDTPGFIVNRLLVPSLMQAMQMLDRRDATINDIDLSLKLGAGHPMGPLHLADYIGLDTCYYIVKGWSERYPQEPSFVVPHCLKEKVRYQHFGRKSGKGFYQWYGEKRGEPVN